MKPCLAALLVSLALAACAAPQPATESPRRIFPASGEIDPGAVGVFRSADYGWILEISPAGITRWQDTPRACYRTPDSPTAQFMGQVEYAWFTPTPEGARFQYLPGDENTPFERLDALPERCGAEALTAPTALFEVFASAMAAHYAFFQERDIDWAARTETARARVHDGMSEAALFDVLAGMLDGLSDSHTKLIAQIDGEVRRVQDGQGETLPFIRNGMGETPWLIGLIDQLLGEVLEDGRHIANDRIVAGTIVTDAGDRVGYVQIFTMGGFDESEPIATEAWAAAERAAFDRHMDEIIGGFAAHDAVIIDLSNNRGGYDAIARDIAARFTDHAFEAYANRPGSSDGAPHAHVIEPADGPIFTGPTAVLTSDVTVSGGEIATLSLRQLDHVVHAGMTTRGSFSTPLAKPLPNGWYLELSNEIYAAPDGQVYEEVGIAPEWEIPVYPQNRPVEGHADALRILAERLTTG